MAFLFIAEPITKNIAANSIKPSPKKEKLLKLSLEKQTTITPINPMVTPIIFLSSIYRRDI